ncbi:MAG: hypothetical protein EBR53_06620, partial [Actinobacteria bacterium]|nr:hypothetical protein [Actinomycetota bacterium]
AASDVEPDLMSGVSGPESTGIEWQHWRWPLRLTLLLMVVNITALQIDSWRLQKEAAGVKEIMMDIYRRSFPNEAPVLDPLAEMQHKIAASRQHAGETAPSDFLALIAAFGDAWTSLQTQTGTGAQAIAAIVYRDQMLEIRFKPAIKLSIDAAQPVLAANALLLSGDEAAKKKSLPGIASGEFTATLATTEPSGKWDEKGITMEAKGSGSDFTLTGTKMFVLDGHTADLIIVAARTGKGVSLFAVDGKAKGLTRTALSTFGRPIGSFQAIKHKCADMLLEVESAKSAAYYGMWCAAEMNDELASVASLAKAYCSEAYFHAAAENIQIHGGIGFTWEHPAHLYFKRAKSSELLFGDPTYHRELLAQRIGI